MNKLQSGWFTEFSPNQVEASKGDGALCINEGIAGGSWPGQAFSLQVREVLYHEKSPYQDILVFESESYGRVLVLDGIIQCTDRDEFAYQEMLTHLGMFSHPLPTKVLIIGGGDGGVLREVLKHSCVESVTLCEIDQMVVDAAKKFLPRMSAAFDSPKLTLYIGDGMEFLQQHVNEFDVVISDSSDPIGPAENLFGKRYYELIKSSLKKGGVLSSQGECPWLDMVLVREIYACCKELYASAAYAIGSVPTYTTGLMGYIVCVKDEERDISIPLRTLSEKELKTMGLRYYNSTVHNASFMLPEFIKQVLQLSDQTTS